MITYLEGILTELSPTDITLEVNGIGHEIFIPLSSFEQLPKIGSRFRILTYLHVREDILRLYGFATHDERDLFRLLISISGIGPRLALIILSGMTVSRIKTAISEGDIQLLCKIPGVGRKTAQRIVIELKERIGGFTIKTSQPIPKEEELLLKDAIAALMNLGYKQQSAQRAAEKAFLDNKGKISLENLVKKALKYF